MSPFCSRSPTEQIPSSSIDLYLLMFTPLPPGPLPPLPRPLPSPRPTGWGGGGGGKARSLVELGNFLRATENFFITMHLHTPR